MTFNIHNAFACLDVQRNGYLHRDDITALMLRNEFHPTDIELELLYIRFDRKLNGYINYQGFMDEILP